MGRGRWAGRGEQGDRWQRKLPCASTTRHNAFPSGIICWRARETARWKKVWKAELEPLIMRRNLCADLLENDSPKAARRMRAEAGLANLWSISPASRADGAQRSSKTVPDSRRSRRPFGCGTQNVLRAFRRGDRHLSFLRRPYEPSIYGLGAHHAERGPGDIGQPTARMFPTRA